MKIALIRKNYTPYGGAENYLLQVAEALSAKGHDIHILSAGKWDGSGYTLHRVRTFPKPSILSNFLFSANLKRVIDKDIFDCILSFERAGCQGIYRAGDGCHKAWLKRRKELEPFYKKVSFAINPHHHMLLHLEKKTFERSDVIIANSNMVRNDIISNYPVAPEKIQVIYNGVNLQKFHPVDAAEKNAAKYSIGIQNRKVVLFVGADLDRKGLPALLRGFSARANKEAMVVVAGKKAGAKHLALIKRLGIENNVILWGPEKDITKLYSAADIFVLPTIYDPFSNATLEAMASGLPVITTSSNGASDLIENGVDGYVINNPDDSYNISEKITAALSLSKEMGNSARKKAEGFSIQRAVDSIADIITGAAG